MEIARNALGARDVSDLHDRLDGCIMRLRELSLFAPTGSRPTADDGAEDLAEDPPESSYISALGHNVAQKLARATREFRLVLQALVRAQEEAGSERRVLLQRALDVWPWSLHDGAVVPHALVESAIVQCRGFVALGALVAACVDTRRPEPWLTNALADAFAASVREMARLTVSAGYDVAQVSPEGLWDLEALFREAEDADKAFVAAFQADVRAGTGPIHSFALACLFTSTGAGDIESIV